MSFLSNLFSKSKRNLPENLSPSTPPEKPSPEPARGGTTLRKQGDASLQPQKQAGPELSALEMAERQGWEVKSLPVWQPGDEILGLYRVEDVIETGGMGRVYIAHHKGWNVKLAIKSPNEMMLSDRNNFARVLREANSWTELGLHPNIAYCYYVRSIEDVPHIFVEYVDGGNLRQWITDGKCIDYRVSLDLAIQFCHGMEHAHSKGMIHRDIKPENVLMTRDGILKITDFGLVRSGAAIETHKGTTGISGKGMTRLGDVMGTEGFMAPEQFTDPSGVDERADIFSFGVCLYEMCCGARPYDITIGERKDAPDPVKLSRDGNFPVQLAELLKKSVQWERDQRYGCFREVREELAATYRDLYSEESPYVEIEIVDLEADGLNNRGVSYFELGRKKEAISCWEQAIKQNPTHLDTTYNLSLILWRDGKISDDEVLRRLDNCENNPAADKERIAEMKGAIHGERNDFGSVNDLLKEFPSKYNTVFPTTCVEKERTVHILKGHKQFVNSLVVTPDGRYLLSGSDDATLRIWELSSGRCVYTLEGHKYSVKSIAITPDGRYAVSGSGDSTLRVWEISSGRCIRTLEGHKLLVTSLVITPEGRYLLSGSDDTTLRVWELSNGRCVHTLEGHEYSVKSLAITLDGRYAVSGSLDKTLRQWDLEGGRCMRTLVGHTGMVTSVALTPNGQYAVSAGSFSLLDQATDHTLRLWDFQSGRCIRTLEGHTRYISSVALTPDSRYAVSGSSDATLRLWDLEGGQCLRTLEGHTDEVTSIALAPDGQYAVSASADKTLRMWELKSGRCIRTLEGHEHAVTKVVITPNGRYAVSSGNDGTLQIWRMNTVTLYRADLRVSAVKGFKELRKEKDSLGEAISKMRNFYAKGDYSNSFALLYKTWKDNQFRENNEIIDSYAKLMRKGKIRALDFSFQKRLLSGHTGEVESIALSSDGRYAMSGSGDKTLRLWEVASGRCVRILEGGTAWIKSVALTPDSRYAVSGSVDKTIRLWELASGKCVRILEGHKSSVNSIAITPDGQYVVSCSYDRTVRMWELPSGSCVRTIEGRRWSGPSSLAITSDGRYAVSLKDRDVLVWDLVNDRCMHVLEGHAHSVTSVALTPDGRYAVLGRVDLAQQVWELASGRCVCTLKGHTNLVSSIAVTPDGRYAISGSLDKTLRVWDINTVQCVRILEGHTGSVTSIALSSDGWYVVSGSHDKTIRIWTLIWDIEFPNLTDWDEGVRLYLEIFVTLHKGNWSEEDFKLLIDELASKRGYGWVRPEGIRKELEKINKEYRNSHGFS